MAETGHWSSTPALIATAILADLETYLGGFCPSISRIPSLSNADIGRAIHKGTPALLVYYGGGSCVQAGTKKSKARHTMTWRVLCLSGNFTGKASRLEGTGEMDMDAATAPGMDELQDFVAYIGLRALKGVDEISQERVSEFLPSETVKEGAYIGEVVFTCDREIDCYDDAITTLFATLGLVQSPTDYDELWLDSPTDTSPDSTLPTGIKGGAEFDPDA